jgi:3-deoxy-D-manno-octulosonic-acid transferase
VGEAAGVPPLVREWAERRPDETLLLSALTPGGRLALARSLPGRPVTAPPVESLGAARRALAASGARRLVLLETEIWPAWLAAAGERGVRVAVANARLSDRAWPRYRRAAALFRPHVARLTAVAAQDGVDAERWAALGAPPSRVRVAGNTKFDRAPAAAVGEAERRAARAALGLDPEGVWCVFGSLRPGEERWLAAALAAAAPLGLRALVVPRHPELWSDPRRRVGEGGAAVWLLRLGVLPEAYRAADFAVVGGTLESFGGHNPVEPAALGLPVLLGRSVANCRAAAAALLAGGGAETAADPAALGAAAARWTADPSARRAAGEGARRAVATLGGAAARTLDWFAECGLWEAP